MNGIRRKIIRMTIITLLLTVIVGVPTLFNTVVAWTKDTPLTSTDEAYDMKPSATQTRDGTLWIFWSSDMLGAQYEIFYATSSDNGTTWSEPPIRITWDAAADDTPYATQTRNGTLWLFWASRRNGNYDIFYRISTDGGTEWSLDCVQFTDDSRDDSCPCVTQNLDGTIFVVWHRQVGIGDYRLFYKTSSDEGVTWSDEMPLTENSWDISPSVTWTYNGTLWVVWSYYNLTDHQYDLVYKTTPDNGLSWSATHRLTTDTSWDLSPSVLQAPDGKMWVFWCTDRVGTDKYGIYYKTSIDYGENWSSDTLLTKSSGSDVDPEATTTRDRKILVTWDSTRSDHDVYYTISDEITPVHDIAVKDLTTRVPRGLNWHWVSRGMPVYINVTVENQGTSLENFDVTVYADRNCGDLHIEVGTQSTSLASGATTKLYFTWDTTSSSYGTYYISANATVVSGEFDTADNILLHGAKIGGICVPWQPQAEALAVLSQTASAILIIVGLGIVAVVFFKRLMSV